MIKVLPPAKAASYAEIGQQLKVLFAWAVPFADNTYQLQHSYVKCRDFLPDFLWMIEGKAKVGDGIYGYQHMKHHVKSPFMAIKVNDGSVENLKANMAKHIPADAIEFIDADGNDAVVKWSDAAMDSPWKISFFTFMLKLCCVQEVDTVQALIGNGENYSPENTYIMSVKEDKIAKILKNWKFLVDPEQTIGHPALQELGISTVHNYSGFVSMFKKSSQSKLAKELELL